MVRHIDCPGFIGPDILDETAPCKFDDCTSNKLHAEHVHCIELFDDLSTLV